ncbi:MAG: 2,3-bisphosphoglycerate-independent phosphoglycerate mutase [Deltaproteobacteria bacterium]|nr:2,3-bisphosphoglycerate-independent phosphoglycerate mutase [Deltaproteobacteria bacterium]
MKNNIRPVMLVIMDGWGWREDAYGNATVLAKTPNLNAFREKYPFGLLQASGEAVGLPEGQIGNSEVGHLNLGAGRIVYQELTRIDKSIRDRDFFANSALSGLMSTLKHSGRRLHLLGLVSDGGVHSQLTHLFALLEMAKQNGLNQDQVCVHAFLDGRDVLPTTGAGYVARLQNFMKGHGIGGIATISGRFYAMDRDKRWDRVQKAYEALVAAKGETAQDPVKAIEDSYARGVTDEFVPPTVILRQDGTHMPRISDGDGVIFFNFRADRARELTRAFMEPGFSGFPLQTRPDLAGFVTLTRYDETFDLPVAFPPQTLTRILGEEVSRAGLSQLRIAETEKYAHVTYFFNGGEEKPFEGEDRVLIPSPREVRTYDLKPEMSAYSVADTLIDRISNNDYALVVVNFANGDMVGHTGVLSAAIRACEVVDECVGRVVGAWCRKGGAAIITADHGNAEVMIAPDGTPATAHTTNPVPMYLIDDERVNVRLRSGILADIAPTILTIQGLPIPDKMTGKLLLE